MNAKHSSRSPVSHPCLHCGLLDNVFQPLLMVPGRLGPSTFFLFPFLWNKEVQGAICGKRTQNGTRKGFKKKQPSHRYWVPLQHQLLGSPHLLLLHLSTDRLFGLVGQLTARRQARIPDHLFNPPEKDQRPKTEFWKCATKSFDLLASKHRCGRWNTK